jgi:DNA gyrase subunit A
VIGTRDGLAIRFHEQEVRPMGRAASGVRAVRLQKGDRAIGAVALRRNGTSILVATEGGYGKRSETQEYRVSHRGGKGIFTVKTTEKTGRMVAIKEVLDTDDIVVVTEKGIVIRQHASEIRVAGRNTQGVRLIRLDAGDTISDVAAVPSEDEEGESSPVKTASAARDDASRKAPAATEPAPRSGRRKGTAALAQPSQKSPPASAPAGDRQSSGKGGGKPRRGGKDKNTGGRKKRR